MARHVVYVARDIERALGKKPEGNYHIITNETLYASKIQEDYPDNVHLIKQDKILDTYELLSLQEVQGIISKLDAEIIVFKNTVHIEQICMEKKWKLLNPSAKLSEKIENKIDQIAWLDELAYLLPEHSISVIKDIRWDNKLFILQWSHGHTGDGTILIKDEHELNNLKEKFPYREARKTDFIKGPMFTINIVVTRDCILNGNISYQITGILPFTENIFSTIGNDWSIPHTILSEKHVERIQNIASEVAHKIQRNGWIGLFGIDIIHDEERDEIFLIEINARQPASATYESKLQDKVSQNGVLGINIFEAHISALLDLPIMSAIIPINDGAQILQRITRAVTIPIHYKELIDLGYNVITYQNTKFNSDLMRIQSDRGIMETHNKFNKRGKEILDTITRL